MPKIKSPAWSSYPTNDCSVNAWDVASFHKDPPFTLNFRVLIYEFKQSVWGNSGAVRRPRFCPRTKGLKFFLLVKVSSAKVILKASMLHGVRRCGSDCEPWTQSCLTLCNPMDCCSPPGSSVHGIFQARILEWVAISSSRESSPPRDRTHVSCVSCIADGFFTHWVIGEAPLTVRSNFVSMIHPSSYQLRHLCSWKESSQEYGKQASCGRVSIIIWCLALCLMNCSKFFVEECIGVDDHYSICLTEGLNLPSHSPKQSWLSLMD